MGSLLFEEVNHCSTVKPFRPLKSGQARFISRRYSGLRFEEQPHGRHVADHGSVHQRSFSERGLRVNVHAFRQTALDAVGSVDKQQAAPIPRPKLKTFRPSRPFTRDLFSRALPTSARKSLIFLHPSSAV